MTGRRVDRAEAWRDLAAAESTPLPHPGDGLGDLPEPARRFLERSLPSSATEIGSVVLDMEGEIKLRTWMPFSARQILHPHLGFVWNATGGRFPMRFGGGDSYWRGRGSTEFHLWGLVPVVRAAGDDIDRSAAGRLAAEMAVWTPQALHPAAGASWEAVDTDQARVTLTAGDESIAVTMTVDPDGTVAALVLDRWGAPDAGSFGLHPFGGTITETGTFDGVTIATEGTVGWHVGTAREADGEFFRFRLTGVGRP